MKNYLKSFIDFNNFSRSLKEFKGQVPFDHCVIDNFFREDIAQKLQSEFMDYEDERWYFYENALENKKTSNNWTIFPTLTYQVFQFLLSDDFFKTS